MSASGGNRRWGGVIAGIGTGVGAILGRRGMARVALVCAALLLWEIGARLFVDPRFLVPPSALPKVLPGLMQNAALLRAFGTTCLELLVSFALSVAIGAPLGMWLGLRRRARQRLLPIVFLLYAVPQVTILPLIVMLFGIGAGSKIAFGVTHGVFPIVFALNAGAQSLDRTLAAFAHLHGANPRQMLFDVTLPQIAAPFFTGMRLAMIGAILGVLLAELYVSSGGVGHFTRMFSDTFQTANLEALVFSLAALAVAFNELLRRFETRFSRWRAET